MIIFELQVFQFYFSQKIFDFLLISIILKPAQLLSLSHLPIQSPVSCNLPIYISLNLEDLRVPQIPDLVRVSVIANCTLFRQNLRIAAISSTRRIVKIDRGVLAFIDKQFISFHQLNRTPGLENDVKFCILLFFLCQEQWLRFAGGKNSYSAKDPKKGRNPYRNNPFDLERERHGDAYGDIRFAEGDVRDCTESSRGGENKARAKCSWLRADEGVAASRGQRGIEIANAHYGYFPIEGRISVYFGGYSHGLSNSGSYVVRMYAQVNSCVGVYTVHTSVGVSKHVLLVFVQLQSPQLPPKALNITHLHPLLLQRHEEESRT